MARNNYQATYDYTIADNQNAGSWEFSCTLRDNERNSLTKSATFQAIEAIKLQQKAARVGFDWSEAGPVLAKIEEELAELRGALEQQDNVVQEDQTTRITSYNVCYTKLLRFPPIVSVKPHLPCTSPMLLFTMSSPSGCCFMLLLWWLRLPFCSVAGPSICMKN